MPSSCVATCASMGLRYSVKRAISPQEQLGRRWEGHLVILAGDVGGTKCNLALFSEKSGELELVYKQRFASKEFATFDLIVKEFSRMAGPYLGSDHVVAAG